MGFERFQFWQLDGDYSRCDVSFISGIFTCLEMGFSLLVTLHPWVRHLKVQLNNVIRLSWLQYTPGFVADYYSVAD